MVPLNQFSMWVLLISLDIASNWVQSNQFHSRHRRYVAFPEGSSFSVAVCATVGVIGNPNPAYLSFGLNWGVAFDLPNTTWVLAHANGFRQTRPQVRPALKRRHKRAVFKAIESGIDNMGLNGRDCILRALCESRRFFYKRGRNMIEEMVRTVFSLPKDRLFTREVREDAEIVHYDKAYRHGGATEDCASVYSDCKISLLELALGKYSQPPPGSHFGMSAM